MCGLALVVIFATKLVSPVLEFERESYRISGCAVLLLLFRPESPAYRSGVSGPKDFRRSLFFLFSPWWGPEFPAQGARVSAPDRSFRPQGTGVSADLFLGCLWFSPWWGPEFPAPEGRSFRPRPEFPVTRARNSSAKLAATALFLGGV